MAELDGIQNLKESSPSKLIVTHKQALLGDVTEQIAFGAILKHNVYAVLGRDNRDQRDNIGVSASLVMELDFPCLELLLARFQTNLVQGLNRIRDTGENVYGGVDYAIGTYSQDSHKPVLLSKHQANTILWCTEALEGW